MPANITDHATWERAKAAAKKEGSDENWDLVMYIYKKMGGGFTHKTVEKSVNAQKLQELRMQVERVPGQVPRRLDPRLGEMPEPPGPQARFAFSEPVLTRDGLTKGLGLEGSQERSIQRFVADCLKSSNEVVFRRQVEDRLRDESHLDPIRRRAILQRSLSYYRLQGSSPDEAWKEARARGFRIEKAAYGFCPECGAPGKTRNRGVGPHAKDRCVNGHEYLSKDALEKADPRGGSYHRRVTDPKSGKHRYFYDAEDYDKRPDAHISGSDAAKANTKRAVLAHVQAHKEGVPVDGLRTLSPKHDAQTVADAVREHVREGSIKHVGGILHANKVEKKEQVMKKAQTPEAQGTTPAPETPTVKIPERRDVPPQDVAHPPKPGSTEAVVSKGNGYGNCPVCGNEGVERDRGPGGLTKCSMGHGYTMEKAFPPPPPPKKPAPPQPAPQQQEQQPPPAQQAAPPQPGEDGEGDAAQGGNPGKAPPQPPPKKPIPPPLAKGLDAWLQKSEGEGSRGGHIIGHTAGGKPIYEAASIAESPAHASAQAFMKHHATTTSDQHRELAAAYRAKGDEARAVGKPAEAQTHYAMGNAHIAATRTAKDPSTHGPLESDLRSARLSSAGRPSATSLSTSARSKMEKEVWQGTHKDYRGGDENNRAIMHQGKNGGVTLSKLKDMGDEELKAHHARVGMKKSEGGLDAWLVQKGNVPGAEDPSYGEAPDHDLPDGKSTFPQDDAAGGKVAGNNAGNKGAGTFPSTPKGTETTTGPVDTGDEEVLSKDDPPHVGDMNGSERPDQSAASRVGTDMKKSDLSYEDAWRRDRHAEVVRAQRGHDVVYHGPRPMLAKSQAPAPRAVEGAVVQPRGMTLYSNGSDLAAVRVVDHGMQHGGLSPLQKSYGCPGCGSAVSAILSVCPHCGTDAMAKSSAPQAEPVQWSAPQPRFRPAPSRDLRLPNGVKG